MTSWKRHTARAIEVLARKRGYEFVRQAPVAPPSPSRRSIEMQRRGVVQVVDVGANVGDYGHLVRSEGFTGTIHAYEPLAEPFQQLQERSAGDDKWHCHRSALGEVTGTTEIHRSENVVSSSILDITQTCIDHSPETAYVDSEKVEVTTLDEIAADLEGGPTWLKLDVQGYELHVLRWGTSFLDRVVGIDCEVSFVALYEGQPLAEDVVRWLRERGFAPSWFAPGVIHNGTGAMLQADLTFERA